MRRSNLVIIILLLIQSLFIFCSEDIGVNDFLYHCSSDKECGEGYKCDEVRGCIRISKDGGIDIGADVKSDISDIEGERDTGELADISDIFDAEDGYDIGDIEDIKDFEEFEDVVDGGIDVQENYLLRLESVYDSNAGVCVSPNYILESVTGFTASGEMKSSNYILHRSMLFSK